jgi:chitinase
MIIKQADAITAAYSYEVPYQGGANLIINNNGIEALIINEFTFIINANITGNPWGSLFPWGSTISIKQNADQLSNTVTVTLPNSGVTIPSGGKAILSYGYQNNLGPLDVAMPPSEVQIGETSLAIDGACEGINCDNPIKGEKVLGGYYTSWDQYARQYQATDIPLAVNSISYAFIGFDASGNIKLLDSNSDGKQLPALAIRRKQYPYVNVSLSFGGWGLGDLFSQLCANPTAMENFVQNTLAAVAETQTNGIDIDWEYPATAADAANYVKLLQSLRSALDSLAEKTGNPYYLSIAAPAGIDKINVLSASQWQQVSAAVHCVNLMTYDYFGGWGPTSDFMSAMQLPADDINNKDPILSQYNIDDTVNAYLNLGFPSSQLILGVPAYGRAVNVASLGNTATPGWNQNVTGTPPGEYNDGSGVYDYNCIVAKQCHNLNQLPTDLQFIEPGVTPQTNTSKTPWAFSASTNTAVSYDDDLSTKTKTQYAVEQQLGGEFFWSLSGDLPVNNTKSLVHSAATTFNSWPKIYNRLTELRAQNIMTPSNVKSLPALPENVELIVGNTRQNDINRFELVGQAALTSVLSYMLFKAGKKMYSWWNKPVKANNSKMQEANDNNQQKKPSI